MENFRAFSQFGEKGKFIVSGGNDKCIKLWNWSGVPEAEETGSNNDILHMNINLSKKVCDILIIASQLSLSSVII